MTKRCALPVLLLTTIAAAQTTHVVSGGGAALQNAINAANPGDILDVMPGTYSEINTAKGVRVMLRAGATVQSSFVALAVTLSGLPAGQTFVLHGGAVEGFQAQNCAGCIIWLGSQHAHLLGVLLTFVNCTGPVVAKDLTTMATSVIQGGLQVTDCAHVSFTNCPLPLTIVTRSDVSLVDSGVPLPYGFTPGLRLVSGSVVAAGGQFRHATNASWPVTGPAILVEQGDLTLTRGAFVTGSHNGFGQPIAPAIDTLGGTVRLDPSVVLTGTVPVAGPAIVTNAFVPSIAANHASGSPTCQFQIAAEPGSVVFTLVNLPHAPFGSPWGAIWLPGDSPIVDVTVLGAGGTHSFAWNLGATVPPLLALVAQSASLSMSNTVAVGAPVRFLWD